MSGSGTQHENSKQERKQKQRDKCLTKKEEMSNVLYPHKGRVDEAPDPKKKQQEQPQSPQMERFSQY